tara:strand:+ start:307 stop:558 length:252 start_codon:yes stop_codon:yes gene_type:complete
MTSLSTSQINVRKFKYQKLSSKDDVKKLKEKLISNVSDYLDDLLQDFVLKEKEMKKMKKKLKEVEFFSRVTKSYNGSKKYIKN